MLDILRQFSPILAVGPPFEMPNMESAAKKSFGLVAEEYIRIGPIMYLEPVLARFDIAMDPLLTRAGLSRDQMSDPENTVPLFAVGKLLAECAEVSRCPHFGLLIGHHSLGESLGLLGDLLPHCADVETALTYLQDFFHLHDRGGFPTISVAGEVALLSYNILVPDLPGFRQIQDTAMTIALNMMRILCGQDWKPGLLRLALGKPLDPRPYQKLFGCKIEFNAECPEIVFPRRELRRTLPQRNNVRFQFLKEELEGLRASADFDFVARVRRIIFAFLVLQRCTLDNVARHFALHRRTLNRRLAVDGVTYRMLLNDARRMLALRMLQHTNLPLAQIAAMLDYSDPSTFTRACQKWIQLSPSAWRARHLQQ